MKQALFDSRQKSDRTPSGAACAGTEICFCPRLGRELGVLNAWLTVICDEDQKRTEYPMTWESRDGAYDRYCIRVPFPAPGIYWYFFRCETGEGEVLIGKGENGAECSEQPKSWQLTVYQKDFRTPDWIKGGAFYHIFVDRFMRSGTGVPGEGSVRRDDWGGMPVYLPAPDGEIKNNDFFGGDLKGIEQKLPYLQSLGVTCIYLSPVFEAESNHKYDTGDYETVDPAFGTKEDFTDLCREAEKRGIRVICDGVFNHTGSDSRYFNKKGRYPAAGAYQSKDSPYYPWYRFIRYPDQYACWWGVPTLPQINKEEPSYRRFICGKDGVARRWLRAGASGWRLDVVDELPNSFVEQLRAAVKEERPDALLIGEVWEDASNKIAYGRRKKYFLGSQLDSVMNYPLREAIIRFVCDGTAEVLKETVENEWECYPKPVIHCLMNLLGSHDTPRILTVLGGGDLSGSPREEQARAVLSEDARTVAKTRLFQAVLLQMTLPGVPSIYYGDEAGMEGNKDPFNRRCYPWGKEDREVQDWARKLLITRRGLPLLREGEYETLVSDGGIFAFCRTDGENSLCVAVNKGTSPRRLPFGGGKDLLDGGKALRALTLPPEGMALILNPDERAW